MSTNSAWTTVTPGVEQVCFGPAASSQPASAYPASAITSAPNVAAPALAADSPQKLGHPDAMNVGGYSVAMDCEARHSQLSGVAGPSEMMVDATYVTVHGAPPAAQEYSQLPQAQAHLAVYGAQNASGMFVPYCAETVPYCAETAIQQPCDDGGQQSYIADDSRSMRKHAWTAEEDATLARVVQTHGAGRWSQVAGNLPGRMGKQCRERWFNHLAPEVKKGAWSAEEDRLIMRLVRDMGTKWSAIVKLLPGRSDNAIKNRYYSAIRKAHRQEARASDVHTAADESEVSTQQWLVVVVS